MLRAPRRRSATSDVRMARSGHCGRTARAQKFVPSDSSLIGRALLNMGLKPGRSVTPKALPVVTRSATIKKILLARERFSGVRRLRGGIHGPFGPLRGFDGEV